MDMRRKPVQKLIIYCCTRQQSWLTACPVAGGFAPAIGGYRMPQEYPFGGQHLSKPD